MSARMETQPLDWEVAEPIEREAANRDLTTIQVECLIRNSDNRNLVASVREVHAALGGVETTGATEGQCRAALARQEQWDAWSVEREQLRNEIKRGCECLEQVQGELAMLQARLEDWPAYERICGRNPLPEYMQALAAKRGIAQFLPEWLKRREKRLQELGQQMEQYARLNGVEHLL